jgi:hypothetical protein
MEHLHLLTSQKQFIKTTILEKPTLQLPRKKSNTVKTYILLAPKQLTQQTNV